MPSFSIHIATANEYLKNYKVSNQEEFIKGVISVDLGDKSLNHYTLSKDESNLKKLLEDKVSLEGFIKENKINNDYNRGRFLHLLTDYYFYNNFLSDKFINSVNFRQFQDTMYHDYYSICNHLNTKYKITYPKEIEKYSKGSDEPPILLKENEIDSFIENTAKANLDKIYNKIKGKM